MKNNQVIPRCTRCGSDNGMYGFDDLVVNTSINGKPIRRDYCRPCYMAALAAYPFKLEVLK